MNAEVVPHDDKRSKGIEPSCLAWEASVLPLYYDRISLFSEHPVIIPLIDRQFVGMQNLSRVYPRIIGIAKTLRYRNPHTMGRFKTVATPGKYQ